MFGRQSGAPNLEDGARHGHFPASSSPWEPAPTFPQLQLDLPGLRDDLDGDAAHGPHWPAPPALPPPPAADEPQLRRELR